MFRKVFPLDCIASVRNNSGRADKPLWWWFSHPVVSDPCDPMDHTLQAPLPMDEDKQAEFDYICPFGSCLKLVYSIAVTTSDLMQFFFVNCVEKGPCG